MSGPRPLSQATTSWVGQPKQTMRIPVGDGRIVLMHYFQRSVEDGTLWAIVSEEPQGWHLSISFRNRSNELSRYPTWDEIAHARYELLPVGLDFVMHLPPPEEYVALHDTTFHLHQSPQVGACPTCGRDE